MKSLIVNILLILSLNVGAQTLEECVNDCKDALQSAQEVIDLQQRKIELQDSFIKEQSTQLTNSFILLKDITDEQNKWYNRKETYGLVGIVLGLIIYGVVQ